MIMVVIVAMGIMISMGVMIVCAVDLLVMAEALKQCRAEQSCDDGANKGQENDCVIHYASQPFIMLMSSTSMELRLRK
jgi:predicted RND superfamily exporter protein